MQTHIKIIGRDLKKTSTLSLSQCYDEAVKSLGLAQSYQQYQQKPETVSPIFLIQVFTQPDRELFRYQFDGSWRNVNASEPYTDGDYFTTKYSEFSLTKTQVMSANVTLNGVSHSFNESLGLMYIGRESIDLKSKVVYCVPPKTLPSFEEMVSEFANTKDEGVNALFLDIYGHFTIRNIEGQYMSGFHDTVYRGESFSARGYVGLDASRDSNYMLSEYRDTIAAWCCFIQDGSTDNYNDSHSTVKLSDLHSLYAKLIKSIPRRF